MRLVVIYCEGQYVAALIGFLRKNEKNVNKIYLYK